MAKRTRVLIILGVVVLCGGYLVIFGVQTFFALEARNIARKMPVAKIAPVELSDLSVSQTPGKKLSYFGCEFEVPWDDIDETKIRVIGKNKAVIVFRSGNALSVFSGPPHEFANTVLSSGNMDRDTFRQIYGDKALESDYEFHRILLETTPDTITPFVQRRQAITQSMLLWMKAISAPRSAESGIFLVRADDFKGFQYGRPQSSPSGINIELFADSGSLSLLFGQKANGPTVISQPDINRILQTLRRLPAETVAVNATRPK